MPTKGNRSGRNFSKEVKRLLAERVAYMCSHPLCRCLTIRPASVGEDVLRLGDAAHIHSAAPGGPRPAAHLTDKECKSFTNGIWLCTKHAREVDGPDWNEYPADLLRNWKAEAEKYVEELVTQDSRLRQLRAMVSSLLSRLRIVTALPGPGPKFDQTMFSEGKIPLTRLIIEAEQTLFENEFLQEANQMRDFQNEMENVYRRIEQTPQGAHLDISDWKNGWVQKLMVDIMRFKDASSARYMETEMRMVNDAKTKIVATKGTILTLNLHPPV